MSILSTAEILAGVAGDQLVVGGVPEEVGNCAYEFRPGKLVRCDAMDDPTELLDWTGPGLTPTRQILPGEMIWVRTNREVALPLDVCALWWQTNRLSRQGLMLINTSMVEPGYRGYLACLFANFGREPVDINSSTVIAKLMFSRLTSEAVPYAGVEPSDYDTYMVEAARRAPRKFLAVADLLSEELQHAQDSLEQSAHDLRAGFREDTDASVRRALWPLGVAAVVVFGAVTFLPWLQSWVQPDLNNAVDSRIDQRLSETVLAESRPVAELETRLEDLERRLDDATTGSSSNTTAPGGADP